LEGRTDLKPLEMGKYRKWLRSHGQFYQKQNDKTTRNLT
jgi:hypothetical protein